jgi:transcriptional antiterminator RfaH
MAWYCLHVKPRAELMVKHNLTRQGVEVCCPMMLMDKRRSQKKEIQVLFQGYVFPWLEEGVDDFHPVTKTAGVISFVRGSSGGRRDALELRPLRISNTIIEDLKRRENAQGIHEPPRLDYAEGDTVRIKEGPFHDYYGRIMSAPKNERFAILLNADCGFKTVEIARDNIEPAGGSHAA